MQHTWCLYSGIITAAQALLCNKINKNVYLFLQLFIYLHHFLSLSLSLKINTPLDLPISSRVTIWEDLKTRAAQAIGRISILTRNYRVHNSSNQLEEVKAVHLIPDLSFQAQNNVTQSPLRWSAAASQLRLWVSGKWLFFTMTVLCCGFRKKNDKTQKDNNPLSLIGQTICI